MSRSSKLSFEKKKIQPHTQQEGVLSRLLEKKKKTNNQEKKRNFLLEQPFRNSVRKQKIITLLKKHLSANNINDVKDIQNKLEIISKKKELTDRAIKKLKKIENNEHYKNNITGILEIFNDILHKNAFIKNIVNNKNNYTPTNVLSKINGTFNNLSNDERNYIFKQIYSNEELKQNIQQNIQQKISESPEHKVMNALQNSYKQSNKNNKNDSYWHKISILLILFFFIFLIIYIPFIIYFTKNNNNDDNNEEEDFNNYYYNIDTICQCDKCKNFI